MKFYSLPIPEHEEVPVADHQLLEQALQTWAEREEGAAEDFPEHAVYVASVSEHKDQLVHQAQLQEILALVKAQGSAVVGHECLTLTRLRPRTLLGKGTARALADRCRQAGAGMLVLDVELSPSQMRNLEDEAGIKVCDREAVILNVFLKNARSLSTMASVVARCERHSGSEMSTTNTSKVASRISSRVDSKLSISLSGSRRIKPTVSLSTTRSP